MKEELLNISPVNFIGAWYLDDLKICDELIDYWKRSPNRRPGELGDIRGDGERVHTDIKDSTDVTMMPDNRAPKILREYGVQLQSVLQEYKKKFSFAGLYSPMAIVEGVNIQHYAPGQGFKEWHAERISSHFPSITRHLVFMTYLNDVTEGGETEFYYQNLKVSPKKGLTLIWPADWTHTHRGVTSTTQEKWIVTGWYNFIAK